MGGETRSVTGRGPNVKEDEEGVVAQLLSKRADVRLTLLTTNPLARRARMERRNDTGRDGSRRSVQN